MTEQSGLKVFISWSGDLAKEVAIRLRDLLPVIFDGVEPWMSDQDIEAGSRGLEEIARELAGTSFGIIVVTNANQGSQWLNFEAGALSKRVDDEGRVRVVPLLVDLSGTELTGPMTQFQWKLLDQEGISELLLAIAGAIGVRTDVVERRLAAEWEPFEADVRKARSRAKHPSTKPRRTVDSMVEETLELVRALASERKSQRPVSSVVSERQHRTKIGAFAEALDAAFLRVWGRQFAAELSRSAGRLVVALTDSEGYLNPADSDVHATVALVAEEFYPKEPLRVLVNGEVAIPF